MKKFIVIAAAVSALCFAGGCVRTSTLEWIPAAPGTVTSTGKPAAYHLKARNCGLYLFNVLPIWSGKVSRPNRKDYELWEDMVNYWDMRRLLDCELHRLKAGPVEDIKMDSYSTGMWGLWIFWKKSMVATGVAVKNMPGTKKTAGDIK